MSCAELGADSAGSLHQLQVHSVLPRHDSTGSNIRSGNTKDRKEGSFNLPERGEWNARYRASMVPRDIDGQVPLGFGFRIVADFGLILHMRIRGHALWAWYSHARSTTLICPSEVIQSMSRNGARCGLTNFVVDVLQDVQRAPCSGCPCRKLSHGESVVNAEIRGGPEHDTHERWN